MWKLNAFAAVTFVLGSVTGSPIEDAPCTRVKQGVVCGIVSESRDGRKFASYRGIPYAQPPIGELRFSEPIAASNWNGTYRATKDAPSCAQKNYLVADPPLEGQEDCLYINVYTPKISTANDHARTRYPVMVYIHGGGWFSGAGNSSLHGPQYFMDEDIVLVTFNYRLGIFGFFSTSDDAATGNWGMKDMILALKWVQDNIKYFNGNPQSVTIFGQSAGAASVHYLMLSNLSNGLFHKAIAQSGSALNLFASPIDSNMIARAQAQFVGCPANVTSAELVDCLRKVDAYQLIEGAENFKFWSTDPLTIYIPTIEKKTENNPNPFLSEYPLNIISKGDFQRVPFIIGIVENEGLIRVAAYVSQSKLRNDLNTKWNELGPQITGTILSVPPNQTLDLWQNMTKYYMPNTTGIDYTDPSNIQNFLQMYSDRSFIYGIYQSASKHARLRLQPTYFYKFNYAGKDTWAKIFAGHADTDVNYVFNKSHCDDLNYLFSISDFFPAGIRNESDDYKLSKQMINIWTNFAKEGKPSKHWNEFSPDNFQYLEIAGPNRMMMKTDLFAKRMQFWESQQIAENR